jgi:tetratricopeptide (TPR) repeat protein
MFSGFITEEGKTMKRGSLCVLVILVLLFPGAGFSETSEIISEGVYHMGDGETPIIAEGKALEQAKRVAVEQAGTYVKSYSKVKNFQIEEDEVQVLASGIMEVTVLDKKRDVAQDAIKFWVKIKAVVHPDRMEIMAERIREQGFTEDYKKMKDAYEQSQKEIEALKKQLVGTKDETNRKDIVARISEKEKVFTANRRFDDGMRGILANRLDEAIEAFSRAIAEDPGNYKAYGQRAMAYAKKRQFDLAIVDFHKVIELKPDEAKAYAGRGIIYSKSGEHREAIADLTRAMELQPDAPAFARARIYFALSQSYRGIGDRENALTNLKKACDLGNRDACRQVKATKGDRPPKKKLLRTPKG